MGGLHPPGVDEWLTDPQSKLLVATIDDTPVALAQISWLAPKEVWLEGGRVDPKYRGRHVFSRLFSQILQVALEMGAEIAYANTFVGNTIVIDMMRRVGAKRVANFIPHHADATGDAFQPLVAESPLSFNEIWHAIERSEICAELEGLYSTTTHPVRCYKLSSEKLKRSLNLGEVLALRKKDKLCSFALLSGNTSDKLLVEYINGQPSSLSEIAHSLRGYCFQKGLSEVIFIPPEISFLLEALSSAGYHPIKEHTFFVFKLNLRQVLLRISS